MQLYNNPFPSDESATIRECPKCFKTFKVGNMNCAVMHYGDGCCHYGDMEILSSTV